MKKILALILALTLTFLSLSLVSCGGTGNGGGNEDDTGGVTGGEGDGTGNGGGEAPATALELIKGGVPCFNIISTQKDAEINAAIDEWETRFAAFGISVNHYADYSVDKMQDCEILIGNDLVQRSEYAVDTHDFGEKGYVIKVQDDKVVICGGNTDSTIEAMTLFLEEHLGINIATVEVTDVSVAKTLSILKVQDDYLIKDVTVGGESLRGATITANRSNRGEYAAAQVLQAALYTKSGIWLKIVSPDAAEGKVVSFNLVEDEGEGGFRAFVDGGTLTFNAEYDATFERGVNEFLDSAIASAEGTVDFAGDYSFTTDISFIRYSDYGAVGDGRVDDFDAIIKTHEFANEHGLRVEADKGYTYYIGTGAKTAYIKTDVDWGDATFIIDDRMVDHSNGYRNWVFKAVADNPSYSLNVPKGMTLSKDAKNVGLTFDSDVMLQIFDSNKTIYNRIGATVTNGGVAQSDVIIVHSNGDIDDTTPLLFDFETVTSITVQPINDTPITITGGIFIQYTNRQPVKSGYFCRGVDIARSNTTVYGMEFSFREEADPEKGEPSAAYEAFLRASSACNILFDSCKVSGRLYNGQGTYGIQGDFAINVKWYNCTQLNDITDTRYWGVMGSSGCKNVAFEKCYLSRFDAHRGLYNATIIDSTIGEIINLVGWGTAYLENVTLCAKNQWFIRLREDYGSIWDGDVIIKNCHFNVKDSVTEAFIIRADWQSHDFGYECVLPNVEIDGFEITYENGKNYTGNLYVFKKIHGYPSDIRNDVTNPLKAPEWITLKGVNYNVSLVQGANCEVIFSETEFKVLEDE